MAYAGSADGYLYALDAGSGEMLWRKLTGAESLLHAGSDGERRLFRFRRWPCLRAGYRDGQERWRFWAGGPVLSLADR